MHQHLCQGTFTKRKQPYASIGSTFCTPKGAVLKPIAVAGIATSMPLEFPSFDENAGNMIHGMAPHELFNNAIDTRRSGWRRYFTGKDAISFINSQCSHYVYSFANFIQFHNFRQEKRDAYKNLISILGQAEVPLIPLGIGAQAPDHSNISADDLPSEAIEFMKFLGEKAELISVRGEFTARVFRELAGVENTVVTGCPSFFSQPQAFKKLYDFVQSPEKSLGVAFNATKLRDPHERRLMLRSVLQDMYWVEVHDDETHQFALKALNDPNNAEVPSYWSVYVDSDRPRVTKEELINHFSRRYRLFRDVQPWYQFHSEETRFSFGTRFHGNMAALLAGRPGMWVTHDSRTKELTRTLHLPNIPLEEAVEMTTPDLEAKAHNDLGALFDNLQPMFDTFNGFLDHYGLPAQKLDF